MEVPSAVKKFLGRAGTVIHSRAVYSKVVREGGPHSVQLREDVRNCLISAIVPIRRAVKSRDIISTAEAVGAVWKAQGRVTDAIIHHEKAHSQMQEHSDNFIDELLAQGQLPATAELAK